MLKNSRARECMCQDYVPSVVPVQSVVSDSNDVSSSWSSDEPVHAAPALMVATAPCPVPQCGATLSDTTQQPCISFFIIQHSPPTKHQCFNISLHFQRIINIATTSAECISSVESNKDRREQLVKHSH